MFAISYQRKGFTDSSSCSFFAEKKTRDNEKDETDRTIEGSGRQRGINRNDTLRMAVVG